MEHDRALQGLVAHLNGALKHETAALQETYEKWRAGQAELVKHKEALDNEATRLARAEAELKRERESFEGEVRRKWGSAPDGETRVVLNVGGQRFETTAGVLSRDRFSMLAAIASAAEGGEDPAAEAGRTVRADADGAYYIDRDWWAFRHVLSYLRSGALPSDLEMLRQLYVESAYFRLNSLRRAVEESVQKRDLPPSVLLPAVPGAPSLDDAAAVRMSRRRSGAEATDAKRADAEAALRWAAWARSVHSSSSEGPTSVPPYIARRGDPRDALHAAAAALAAAELEAAEAADPRAEDRARAAGGSIRAQRPLGPDDAGIGLVDLVRAMERSRTAKKSKKRDSLDSESDEEDDDSSQEENMARFTDAYYTSGDWKRLYQTKDASKQLPDPLGFRK